MLSNSRLLSEDTKIKIYGTIILPGCGCETWYDIEKEEHKLRVFENMVLRKIFGPQTDEVAGVEKTT
jgi:hypothetical protein